MLAEVGHCLEQLGIGVVAGHHFEQTHVADRIEEVGDHEMASKVVTSPLGHIGHGEPRSVGRHNAARSPVFFDHLENLAFDVESFHDDFHDPVALAQLLSVVFVVAGGDELEEILAVQQGRSRLADGRQTGQRKSISNRGIVEGPARRLLLRGQLGGGDIEEIGRDAGIGEVGGNALSHDTCPENRNPFDRDTHGSS